MNHRTINILAMIFFLLGVIILTSSCQTTTATPAPTTIPEQQPRMVIASHVGEITEEVRCKDEVIKYRIYYENGTNQNATISISDPLNPYLSQVSVLNNGSYNEEGHFVTWKFENVSPGQSGFVEFSAVIGDTDTISNQAEVQLQGVSQVKTNIVETTVCKQPILGWIPFTRGARTEETPSAVMKDEMTMGLTVNFAIPGMVARELMVDNVTYHRFSILGYDAMIDVGNPELPIVGQVLEVPYDVNFEIEIIKAESITLDCYNVYPAQEPVIEQQPEETDFILNENTYQADIDFPGYLSKVTAEDLGVIRGHRLIFLKVNPVQYNPVNHIITAYSQIEVRLNYDRPAQINPIASRLLSPAFEALLKESVLNYKDPARFLTIEDSTAADYYKEPRGCDYLIITDDSFYDPATATNTNPIVQLMTWKQQKGLLTRVVRISTIGNTPAQIQTYLQNAYDTWYPAPSYVLLVGDANLIVPDYRTAHPWPDHWVNAGTSSEYSTMNGTDLYYATLDGGANDIFPDIMIGRISADSPAEVSTIVGKILIYEKEPPTNTNFYNNTSLVRLFEDDTDPNTTPDPPDGCPQDGQEDCGWILIEQAEALLAFLNNNQYVTTRIYNTSGAHPAGPTMYEDGTTPVPPNLTFTNGFMWDGDHHDIEDAFNNGNFLITYRGHGGRDGWAEPDFHIADFANLNNGTMTPVIFGPSCQTGWFDDETDDPGLNTNTDSYAEMVLRENNAGAVAIIASTRNSWGSRNNPMFRGMIDALWPDFDPSVTTGYLPRMGQILTYSKVFLARNESAHLITFEITHLFGDPEMPVWIEEPQDMIVDHPIGIGAVGEQDFVVQVSDNDGPINNAVVSLTRNNKIVYVKQTNPGGFTRFTLDSIGDGDLEITVTSLKHRPYLGKIIVSSDGGVINRLIPPDGAENETFYVGGQNFAERENVDLYFGNLSAPVATIRASAGSWGQFGEQNVEIRVPFGYPLGPVNFLAHGTLSNFYAVDVFQVRTSNPIDLYLYSQWDQSTWNLTPETDPTWNNPDIQFYDTGGNPVGSNNLEAGIDYTVRVRVHNDTDFDANNVRVIFKWANFGIGQPDRTWEEANQSPVVLDVPAHSVKDAQITWAPPSTGHLCMLVEIYHVEDIITTNNLGQENLHVGPTSSPAEVPFLVYNPTDKPVMVFLEVRQLVKPGDEERLWGVWVRQPEPQLILPGEAVEAWVIIDPKFADVSSGFQAEFALTAYVDGKVIGGVNFIIIVNK